MAPHGKGSRRMLMLQLSVLFFLPLVGLLSAVLLRLG